MTAGSEGDALPRGFPSQGTVSSGRTPALIICQAPGCAAGVTVIVLHNIVAEDQVHSCCHQLCDQHATENEEFMRSVYTVKPVRVTWRAQSP